MSPVQKNEVLVIPAPSDDSKKGKRITISWSQSWSSRTGDYYTFIAQNKSQDGLPVVFFIQVEYYDEGKLSEYGKKAGDQYEITVSDKLQFGQKNASGEGRFVVLHDKSREMYQHRFVETALASSILGLADKVNGVLAVIPQTAVAAGVANQVSSVLKAGFGDYLKTF